MAKRRANPIRHGFTHFEVLLEPVRFALTEEPARLLENSDYLWYNPALDTVGVPAPISTFLEKLSEMDP